MNVDDQDEILIRQFDKDSKALIDPISYPLTSETSQSDETVDNLLAALMAPTGATNLLIDDDSASQSTPIFDFPELLNVIITPENSNSEFPTTRLITIPSTQPELPTDTQSQKRPRKERSDKGKKRTKQN